MNLTGFVNPKNVMPLLVVGSRKDRTQLVNGRDLFRFMATSGS